MCLKLYFDDKLSHHIHFYFYSILLQSIFKVLRNLYIIAIVDVRKVEMRWVPDVAACPFATKCPSLLMTGSGRLPDHQKFRFINGSSTSIICPYIGLKCPINKALFCHTLHNFSISPGAAVPLFGCLILSMYRPWLRPDNWPTHLLSGPNSRITSTPGPNYLLAIRIIFSGHYLDQITRLTYL